MSATIRNALRLRSVIVSRHFKELFFDGEKMKRSGEIVLADLRRFCRSGHGQTIFSTEALQMARMEGRREVFRRLIDYLNLNEEQVNTLMEVEDGL